MKNLKKIALGLVVASMAIGFSAFTNAKGNTNFAMRYWINDGSGNYVESSTTPDPLNNCQETSSFDCVVESTSASIPATFPLANPSHYSVTPDANSKKALYTE